LAAGSGSRITPVENGRIWAGAQPSCCASAAQVSLASDRPSSPVPALALPVLTSSAAIGCRWFCGRQMGFGDLHRRGAEAVQREHPATVAVGASFITSTSCGSVFDAGFGKADFDTVDGFQFGGNGQRGIDGHFVFSWVEGKPLL
jgi:hypothetical protein